MLNSRPLAVGSAGGGFVAGVLHLLSEASRGPVAAGFEEVCNCLATGYFILGVEVDLKSLAIGVAIGYCLGPILEALVLLRQLWGLHLRSRARGCAPGHYKVLDG